MSSPPATTTFDDDQYNLPYSIGSEHHFWNIARNRIIERHLRRVIAAQQMSNGLVLDVGCGPGVVVDHLRRAGIDCEGVELGRPPVRSGLEPFVRVGTDANIVARRTSASERAPFYCSTFSNTFKTRMRS